MNSIGIGTDLVENERIEKMIRIWGLRFLNKIFTPQEIFYCQEQRFPYQHFAVRWAAKEAIYKALPLSQMRRTPGWLDVEILRAENGEVSVKWSNAVLGEINKTGIVRTQISLSHTEKQSMAFVILLGENTES